MRDHYLQLCHAECKDLSDFMPTVFLVWNFITVAEYEGNWSIFDTKKSASDRMVQIIVDLKINIYFIYGPLIKI